MIFLEPLGTDVILPALLVGYELPAAMTAAQVDAAVPTQPTDPNGPGDPIVGVSQQAGGVAMSYPTAVGALLRLAANDGKGRRPLGALVRGLKAMAEEPDLVLLRQFPALHDLVLTRGGPYTPAELRRLESFLHGFIAAPALASGLEAFVRFARCSPLAHFAGWKVLGCRVDVPTPGPRFDDRTIGDLRRDDRRTLDGALIDRITEVGRRLGQQRPPDVFLLWENSD